MFHTADMLKIFQQYRGDAIVVPGRGGRHWTQISTMPQRDVPLGDPAMGVSQTYVSDNQNRGTATNVGGYVNPEIDKLFAEGAATNDPAVRQKVYSEVQKVISADLPVIWSHQMSLPTVYRSKLNNLITTGLGLNSNFADVWIAKD